MPTPMPDLLWQEVGTDLFEWKRSTYLLITDYFSRWIVIVKLDRHGSPEMVISDNGPQFASESLLRLQKIIDFSMLPAVLNTLKEMVRQREVFKL